MEREWWRVEEDDEDRKSGLRIVSYNVLAQKKAKTTQFPYCRKSDLNWAERSAKLLKEVLEDNPDVVCLQEVDRFSEFWRPKMGQAGFDAVFKLRPRNHCHGVAVFFKRETFQLFKSEEIDFNQVGVFLGEKKPSARLEKDNVGLIVGLQPWEQSTHPSAIVVSNVQLVVPSCDDLRIVQRKQVLMLLRSIERFNFDFQLPVVLAGSFNFDPKSELHFLLQNGRFKKELLPPDQVSKRPVATPWASSHAELIFRCPNPRNARIRGFVVKQRCGRNPSGFQDEHFFLLPSISEGEKVSIIISGLASGLTYEFIVAPMSAVGVGTFSQPSAPIRIPEKEENVPQISFLKNPSDCDTIMQEVPIETMKDWLDETSLNSGAEEELLDAFEDKVVNLRDETLVHLMKFETMCAKCAFTKNSERFQGCTDYIFFTGKDFRVAEFLEVPSQDDQFWPQHDVRQEKTIPDSLDAKPLTWDDNEILEAQDAAEEKNPDFMGSWNPITKRNPKSKHTWFPNARFPSDHISLKGTLVFHKPALASTWD